MSQNIAQTPVAQRLILVQRVVALGPSDAGQALQGINVNDLPEGALAYVVKGNRFYRLKKTVVTQTANVSPFYNVVSGLGSDGAAHWVACLQLGTITLEGGGGTITTFDLSGTGQFVCSPNLSSGTPGFTHAIKTNATTASVLSTNGADTSTYLVQYIETSAL